MKNCLKITLVALVTICIFSLNPFSNAGDIAKKLEAHERKGSHGMVIYGKNPYFMSHIPISGHHSAHNLQIIARVSLKLAGKPYTPDLSTNGFSVAPHSRFSLNDFALGDPFLNGGKSYAGDIVKGNFEDSTNSSPFEDNVVIKVEKILVVRNLPPLGEEKDFVIGKGDNQYRVNKISPKQMFQKVTNVKLGIELWCLNGPDFLPKDNCLK